MIETGAMMGAEESGGFGFGMHLPERDGVYADLLLLDLFLREKAAGRWPVSKAIEHFHEIAGPSFYRRIDVHVGPDRLPGDEAAPAGRPARPGADGAGRPAGHPDRSRSTPTTASSSSSPTARGCWSGRRARSRSSGSTRGDVGDDARRDAVGRRAAGPRLMTARWRVGAAGRQALGPRAHLGAHGPVRRQGPRHRGRQAAVAPAPRDQGRDRSSSSSGRLRLYLEDDDGVVRPEELGPGRAPPRPDRPRSIATRRSSAAS